MKNLTSKHFLSAVKKRNPGDRPLMVKYGSKALTGHIVEAVFPRVRVTPCLSGSVFDYPKVICSAVGECLYYRPPSLKKTGVPLGHILAEMAR